MSNNSLIIFGIGQIAEVMHYYFENESHYDVIGFCVDDDFKNTDIFCGLPVITKSELIESYKPDSHSVFIAMGYSKINEVRESKYLEMKRLGYRMASFVSANASVASNVIVGENTFIFEENTIQPFVNIKNNCIIWSGNHIGHHSVVEDNVFISSHVVVSGGVTINKNCFIGVNATIRNDVNIGERSVIGAGSLILSDVDPNGVYLGKATERSRAPSSRLRNI